MEEAAGTGLNALGDEEFRAVVRRFLHENDPPGLRNPPLGLSG